MSNKKLDQSNVAALIDSQYFKRKLNIYNSSNYRRRRDLSIGTRHTPKLNPFMQNKM